MSSLIIKGKKDRDEEHRIADEMHEAFDEIHQRLLSLEQLWNLLPTGNQTSFENDVVCNSLHVNTINNIPSQKLLYLSDIQSNIQSQIYDITDSINKLKKKNRQTHNPTPAATILPEPSTGVYNGGEIINICGQYSTKFSITEGFGVVNNLTNNKITNINWSNMSIELKYVQSYTITFVSIDTDGNVIQKTHINHVRHDEIYLGAVEHINKLYITGIIQGQCIANNMPKQLKDISNAIGCLNISGNKISETDGMCLIKSNGQLFHYGCNNFNMNNPHLIELPIIDTTKTICYYRLGNNIIINTITYPCLVCPNNYDNMGCITQVPINKYTIQNVYVTPSNTLIIQYGTQIYDSFLSAKCNLHNTECDNVYYGEALIAHLILKQGTINLSNKNENAIANVDKYGHTNLLANEILSMQLAIQEMRD